MHTKYYFHCKHHVTARCPGDTRTAVSAALLVNVWTFPWFSSDPKSKYGNDGILPNPFQCSADQDPMIRGNKMPTRCNRLIFIADIIVCSTCFGHHYAHHQELESIIQVVAACRIWCLVFKLSVWCGAEGCVSCLRATTLHLLSYPCPLTLHPSYCYLLCCSSFI